MILTVTLNPMLDKTVELDTLRRGSIHRSGRVASVVGGKGVNVARQLTRLSVDALATGFLGGEIGAMLQRLMTEEGLRHDFLRIDGMTREGVTYRERDGTWTAVFEPPHPVTSGEADRLIAHVVRRMEGISWVVCSGSSPAPASDHVFAAIITEARRRGIRSWLDSYGEVFRQAFAARPTVVQCNRGEIEGNLSLPAGTEGDLRRIFDLLRSRGIQRGIVTNGAGTAYASEEERLWSASPPPVEGVNPTGSGDSLAAGILASLERGEPFAEACRYGMAAGAANAGTWGVANSSPEEINALLPGVRMNELSPLSH